MASPTIGEFAGFPPEAFAFYRDLEDNNSKAWFDEHRDTYDQKVRLPMEEFMASAAEEFGDDGKVFRPNRDVRFSKDKSPYKVTCGAVLGESDGSRPGWYVQISSEGLFAATGFWQMARDQVDRFHRSIDDDVHGRELEALVAQSRADGYDIGGSSLKTGPRGYPKDHERIELLRHKSLTLGQTWPVFRWASSREAYDRVTGVWRAAAPINEWLARHVGASNEIREGPR